MFARFVSAAVSPPALIVGTVLLAAVMTNGLSGVGWAVAHVLIGIGGPVAYLVVRHRGGDISDLDVERREERLFPQVVTVASLGGAFIVIRAGAAPGIISRLALLLFLQSFLVLNITLRWKISVHSTVAAMAGCMVLTLTGSPLALLLGLPLVMWSRIHLERHTPAQTLAGAALGIGLFLPAQGYLLGG
jgi:membrane-associated phospholipid phosphatase